MHPSVIHFRGIHPFRKIMEQVSTRNSGGGVPPESVTSNHGDTPRPIKGLLQMIRFKFCETVKFRMVPVVQNYRGMHPFKIPPLIRQQRLMYSTRVCSFVNLRGGWVGRGVTPPPTHLPPHLPTYPPQHPPTPPTHLPPPPTYPPHPPTPPTHPPTTCIIIN